ncbi:hypothetical protein [Niveispirillum sp. KHB5.9]|uniref:hypothetical protein n=1 Tax=Niveispirillum sp. KHB5.9 TaxID=3400269 RepID=UPI003A84213E
MSPEMKARLRYSLILSIIAVIAGLGLFDRAERAFLPKTLAMASQEALHDNLAQATAVFATARVIDAAVSVAQTVEVSAGLGVQPGQVLDPVNDLVERFSTMMLGATVVLGGATLLVKAGDMLGLAVLLPAGLLLAALAAPMPGMGALFARRLGTFLLFAALVLKVGVPLVVLGSASLSAQLLDPAIADAQLRLDALSLAAAPVPVEGDGGLMDRLRALGNATGAVTRLVSALGDLADIVIDLTIAYAAKLVLLPLLLFWILGRMAETAASSLTAWPGERVG